ncbi:MAG: hypothetical protein ACP5NK_07375 [Thermoplasmata archaeon]
MQFYLSFILNLVLFLLLSISLGFAVFRITVIRSFMLRLKTESEYSSAAYLSRLSVRYSRVFMLGSFLVSLIILYAALSSQSPDPTYLIEHLLPVPLLTGIIYVLMETMLFPLMNHYYEITRSMESGKSGGVPVHVKVLQDKMFPEDLVVLLLIMLVLLLLTG